MTKVNFIGKEIVVSGDVWKVVGTGTQLDGSTFCHLASTTRFRAQKNGQTPIQINDWVDTAVLEAAEPAENDQQKRDAEYRQKWQDIYDNDMQDLY